MPDALLNITLIPGEVLGDALLVDLLVGNPILIYLWAKGCAYFWAVPYIGKYTIVEATTQVVSIGRLTAFLVVLVPMEIN